MIRTYSDAFRCVVFTLWLLVASQLCATSCKREPPHPAKEDQEAAVVNKQSERISLLIKRLQDPKEGTRRAALNELRELGRGETLSIDEGIQLLRATTLLFSKSEDSSWGIPTWIIAALSNNARPEYLAMIKELFPHWSPLTQERGLDLTLGINEAVADETFMGLLREYTNSSSSPVFLGRLQRDPRHPEIFFPGLLELAKRQAVADEVYLTAITFCEKGLLPHDKLLGYTGQLLESYHKERDWLLPRQQEKGIAWIWEEEYQNHRLTASLLLDLMSCLPTADVEDKLVKALKFRDQRLSGFAALSLLKQRRPVSPETLVTIAASPEMRISLFQELQRISRLDLFPRQYLTQEAFAESDMVNWLAYPTELGRVPDEIELKKTFAIDVHESDDVLDYYVFRFRTYQPHWAAKDGWMAGVSGPFLRKEEPSPNAYGGTFSKFAAWDSMTPEQHLGDIRSLMEKWREYHAKEPKNVLR